MRIGAMVGEKADGSFEYIGKPGDVQALIDIQAVETLKGNYIKTWIVDVKVRPLKAKKCVGEPDAPAAKAKK